MTKDGNKVGLTYNILSLVKPKKSHLLQRQLYIHVIFLQNIII